MNHAYVTLKGEYEEHALPSPPRLPPPQETPPPPPPPAHGVGIGNGTILSPPPKMMGEITASASPTELSHYYTKLINYEFRNLQLDKSLANKSLFDLIDYCELLYEKSTSEISSLDPKKNLHGIKTYTKGYLIFNYFINSFIMIHFKGFDSFIETNETDFIIYLNIYAFYNHEIYFSNGIYSISSEQLQKYSKKYLIDNNLLRFDIDELYTWLNDYIEYLKEKDQQQKQQGQSQEEVNLIAGGYESNTPPYVQGYSSQELLYPDETQFKQRYPSLDLNRQSSPPVRGAQPSSSSPPPIPKQLPPGLTSKPLYSNSSVDLLTTSSTPSSIAPQTPPLAHQQKQYRLSKRYTAPAPVANPFPGNPQAVPLLNNTEYNRPRSQIMQYPNYGNDYYQQQVQVQPPQQIPPVQPQYINNYPQSSPIVRQSYTQPNMNYQVVPQPVISPQVEILRQLSVCGLRNFGSSCYINSTVQILFGISSFKSIFNHGYQKYITNPKYLQILDHQNSHNKNSVLLADAIAGLLRTFQTNGSLAISPTKFIRICSLLKPDFNIPHEQQDAQEYLLFILERLHDEFSNKQVLGYDLEDYIRKWQININVGDKNEYLNWYNSLIKHEGTSQIHDLFQGHLQNKLTCTKCSYESISYSPFSILSLPIPRIRNKQMVDLTDCLRYYTQDEVLSGENAWHCPRCNGEIGHKLDNHPVFVNKKSGIFQLGKKSKPSKSSKSNGQGRNTTVSTKSLTFVKLPQILFIHLSRFSMYNVTDKLDTVIKYPLLLKFNNKGHEIVYKLSGLINHFGNLKSGHYTSLVNKAVVVNSSRLDNIYNPFWCLFDDENVHSNVPNGSLNGPYNELTSKDVYVLSYERV
ncbi:Ubiquitin carboxyl-terminal hydrolase 7 [Spathaspora sp. JA1]|nr:Ubiquitin carboxyl-terminal hydrolase 7 [Spathaspora sp. JA1]